MNNDLKALREKAFSFLDTTTNNTITIKISDYYLSLKVNNRWYYFNIDDGKYDGCSDEIAIRDQSLPSQIDAIFS